MGNRPSVLNQSSLDSLVKSIFGRHRTMIDAQYIVSFLVCDRVNSNSVNSPQPFTNDKG